MTTFYKEVQQRGLSALLQDLKIVLISTVCFILSDIHVQRHSFSNLPGPQLCRGENKSGNYFIIVRQLTMVYSYDNNKNSSSINF